jgi:hypothetical protein
MCFLAGCFSHTHMPVLLALTPLMARSTSPCPMPAASSMVGLRAGSLHRSTQRKRCRATSDGRHRAGVSAGEQLRVPGHECHEQVRRLVKKAALARCDSNRHTMRLRDRKWV